MEKKVKVKNKETGVTKEVTEMLAGELVGTKEWEVVEAKKDSKPANTPLNFSNDQTSHN